MCTCLKDASVTLEEHLKGKIKFGMVHSYERSGFDHECIMFSVGGGSESLGGIAIGLPFTLEYYKKKKDGTRAANLTFAKTNLFMTYCPICGKKYPIEK